jgi:hypothetical protein
MFPWSFDEIVKRKPQLFYDVSYVEKPTLTNEIVFVSDKTYLRIVMEL